MRRQAVNNKKRSEKLLQQSKDRALAVRLLKEGNTIRETARITGVTRSTIQRIRNCITSDDKDGIRRMTSTKTRAGRPTVISTDEAAMINERLKLAAKRGFAVDNHTFKHVLSRVAADGRKGYQRGVPSDEAVRTYRAHNRDITYRRIENKEHAKLAAESYEHIETFFSVLDTIQKTHPGILFSANRVWNTDETAVDCTLGKWTRCFTSADTKNGGHRGVKSSYGISKHITAVIAASASGTVAPPFFIIAGKRKSSDWWSPVTGRFNAKPCGIIEPYMKEGWFPTDGCIKVTENGSMEGPVLSAFVQHVEHTARQDVPKEEHFLLFLDGHSSRKHPDWVEYCSTHNIEVVINAANTSHILQPCDQLINKRFHEMMREIRDEFYRQGSVDATKVNFNLACAVYAWKKIEPEFVQQSFRLTGTFPFQRSFAEKYRTFKDEQNGILNQETKRLQNASVSSRLPSVRQRHSDQDVFNSVMNVIDENNTGVSKKLQEIEKLLKKHETINSILMEKVQSRQAKATHTATPNGKRVLYDAGQSAEWLTHGAEMAKRRAEEQAKKTEEQNRRSEKMRKIADKIRSRVAAKEASEKKKKEAEGNRLMKEKERQRKAEESIRRKEARVQASQQKKHKQVMLKKARILGRAVAKNRSIKGKATDKERISKGRKTSTKACEAMALLVLEAVEGALSASGHT